MRSSRVGQGIVAGNGEANDDELDSGASDTLNPQKVRILVMLALTKISDTKEIQRMFHTYRSLLVLGLADRPRLSRVQ